MSTAQEEMELKFKLVSEICFLPNIACPHRRNTNNPIEKPFLDWYRLLRVEEDASVVVIRKQYLKLALQLHPDKNKHPKAETAFKLVSEAYSCLSDSAKRELFNLKRWKNLCTKCSSKRKPDCPGDRIKESATRSVKKSVEGMRERFREEVRVIEKCLRTADKESPVFSPSARVFQSNYNKQRRATPVFDPSEVGGDQRPAHRDMFRYLSVRNYGCRRGNHSSPVFEVRTDHRDMFGGKSACPN